MVLKQKTQNAPSVATLMALYLQTDVFLANRVHFQNVKFINKQYMKKADKSKSRRVASNKKGTKRSLRNKKVASEKHLRREELEKKRAVLAYQQEKEREKEEREINKIISSHSNSLL